MHADELREQADALLDAMDPDDVDDLLSRRVDRTAFLDALTGLAAVAGADIPPAEHRTLLLACLSLRPGSFGVKAREKPERVHETYLRYLPLSYADPRDLVPAAADHPNDLEPLTPLLTRARRVREGLRAAGSDVPEFFVEPVALAVAASAGKMSRSPADDGPAERAAQVDVADRLLARGAALARDHGAAGRRVPGAAAALPIIGNQDFLVRLAAHRLLLAEPERARVPTEEPVSASELDDLDREAGHIGADLGAAMSRPVGVRARILGAEPDVLAGADQYAAALGEAVGGRETSRLLRLAYTVRTRRSRPRRLERPQWSPVEWVTEPDHTSGHADLDRLASWLLCGLFERADPALRGPLVAWLTGRLAPDQQDVLTGLLRLLRVGVHRLDEAAAGDHGPPCPPGLSEADLLALHARVTAMVRIEDLSGDPRTDAHRLAHLGLPRLWTRRRAVVRMLAAHRRAQQLRGDTVDKRTTIARAASRAPVQFLHPGNHRADGPCCPDTTGTGADPGRPPSPELTPCPHRPWGEIGVVDTYRTISDDTAMSPESVRKLLARYRGPDRELLLGVQKGLTPEDC